MNKSLEDLEYRQTILLYLIRSSMDELEAVESQIEEKTRLVIKELI